MSNHEHPFPHPEGSLPLQDAALRLGTDDKLLRAAAKAGALPSFRASGGLWFLPADLDAYAASMSKPKERAVEVKAEIVSTAKPGPSPVKQAPEGLPVVAPTSPKKPTAKGD